MSEAAESLFIVAYSGRETADQVYKTLRGLEKANKLDIKTAATLRRKANGKLVLKHKRRVTVGKGVVGGGVLGLLLAGFTGGGSILAGAVVGALVGSTRSMSRREAKRFLVDKIGQDDSALVILIKSADWETIWDATKNYGGEEIHVELTAAAEKQIAQLAADEEVAEAVSEEIDIEEEEVE